MAISGHLQSQITARAGLLRAGTGRAACVGDAEQIYLTDEAPNHYAGEFKYTERPTGDTPEEAPTTAYTEVAR